MSELIDLAGRRFGLLLVLRRAENIGKHTRWACRCDCGQETTTASTKLVSGRTQSCGCKRSEITTKRNIENAKHGMYDSPEWRSWRAMKDRCQRQSNKKFRLYGGRGISVCERWMDFANFLADMGLRPTGTTLDRFPDKNGNYEPGNCRWATVSEQNRNRRSWAKKKHLGADGASEMMEAILSGFDE